MPTRILIVAHDVGVRAAVARALRPVGYRLELADGARRARAVIAANRIDLAIVALDGSGRAAAAQVEELHAAVRLVVVIAERAEEVKRLTASLGDDLPNLPLPIDDAKLRAHVEAALARRRSNTETRPSLSMLVRFEDHTLNIDEHTLFNPTGREVHLTRAEFALLCDLALNPGRVRSREQLRKAAGGVELEEYERGIDMHVSRLRRKIEPNPQEPRLVLTAPGLGYRFGARVFRVPAPEQAEVPAPAETGPPASTERRILTVLSCSIDGFTEIAESHDPEDVHDATAALRETCGEIIERYGGVMARFIGDGLTAYFGYPKAHELDVERAVRAALDLVEAIGEGPPSVRGKLRARLGVATGLSVVGDLGSNPEDLVAIGEPVRLAVRFRNVAAGGTVVVGSEERRAAGRSFTYQRIEPSRLGGAGVSVWQVTGKAARLERFAARRAAGLTRFAGRAEELGILGQRWREAGNGAGQVVLLSGEPGIGKSRLVYELRKSIGEHHTWVPIFASPYHTGSPLFPVLRHLERAARWSPLDSPQRKLERLRPLLSGLPGATDRDLAVLTLLLELPGTEEQRVREMSPERRKQTTFRLLQEMLAQLSVARPVLVVCEDAQWLDSVSLELLASLIDPVQSLRVLVLVTARPEFKPAWSDYAHTRQYTLSRLDRTGAAALVRDIVDQRSSATAVAAMIDRADGVPLFLEELAKSALQRAKRGTGTAQVPASLQGLLLARVDGLGRQARSVAQLGAVIGNSFTYELLRMLDVGAHLDDALVRIGNSELVFRHGFPPHASYVFKHALVRDAAYGTLSERSRRELHGRVAVALEAGFPDAVETQPELLAHHYAQAGNAAKSVDYLIVAAERALLRSAGAAAQAQIEAALRLLSTLPEDQRRHHQELAAQILLHRIAIITSGRTAPIVGHALQRARELCMMLDDQAELASILFGQWYTSWSGASYREAGLHAQALLSWAKRHCSPSAEICAEFALGLCRLSAGAFREAQQHLEAALASDSFQGLPGKLVAGYWAEGVVRVSSLLSLQIGLSLLGSLDYAHRIARDADIGYQAMTQPYARAIAMLLVCRNHSIRRDWRNLVEPATNLVDLAQQQGYRDFVGHALAYRGWALAMMGEVATGTELIRQGIDRCRQVGYLTWHSQMLMMEAECKLRLGDVDEALRALDEAEQLIDQTGEYLLAAEIHRLRGEILRSVDRFDRAEQSFDRALDIARQQGARLLELRAATSLARLWRDQARRDDGRDLVGPILNALPRGFALPDFEDAAQIVTGPQ